MLRGQAEGELIARPLLGSMWLPVHASSRWFVHMLAGQAEIRVDEEQLDIASGSNVWIDVHLGDRVHIDGGGELVLVKLARD